MLRVRPELRIICCAGLRPNIVPVSSLFCPSIVRLLAPTSTLPLFPISPGFIASSKVIIPVAFWIAFLKSLQLPTVTSACAFCIPTESDIDNANAVNNILLFRLLPINTLFFFNTVPVLP